MKIEIRADGAHISGYVNATEKKSRPVMTPHGRVVEEIEPRAFAGALERAGNVNLTVDHDDARVYASTRAGTLSLREDDIGLHAEALVTDPGLIGQARSGKIRGWSFGMSNVQDELEVRAEGLPLRRVKALDLDHVTLVINKTPCYSATSVELRAEGEVDVEIRSSTSDVQIVEEAPRFDNSAYRARAAAVKKMGG
ncbi:MAG: HK97 family phage prohead protease, partial [Candidatus Spyradocola sp.]